MDSPLCLGIPRDRLQGLMLSTGQVRGKAQSPCRGTAHLAEGGSRLLKASNLQPFLEEVQGVREGLADDASSAATQQVFEVL